jgi:dTDP-4-dehydrorhamnose reductase
VQQALAQGWEVAATSYSQPYAHPQARWLRLDLRHAAETERQIGALRPDAIIHTAYVQSGPDLYAITALGAESVARAARACGSQLILISSDAVFDGEQSHPYTESDLPSPVNAYGRAKADAEKLVCSIYPQAAVVRTSLIYGGSTLSNHEQTILDVADGRAAFGFYQDEIRCPVQVGDLAKGILATIACRYQGILNVAGSAAVSRYVFAQLVARYHGRINTQLPALLSPGPEGGRPRNCVMDSSRAQAILGVTLRGVWEILRRTEDPGLGLPVS